MGVTPLNEADPLEWWARILGGHDDARLIATGGDVSYVALPRPSRATMLIDSRSSSALADAVGRPGEGRLRATAGHVLRLPGMAQLAPRVLRPLGLHSPGASLRALLGEIVTDDPRLAATCGPLRPNRKPVVRVLDTNERLCAVAKIGWDGLTRRLVATEAAALERLDRIAPDVVATPRVLRSQEWAGHQVLVTEALPIDQSQTPDTDAAGTVRALVEIAGLDRRTVPDVTHTTFFRRIADRLDDPRLASQVVPDGGGFGGGGLDIGGFHGDWSPWNTQPVSHGRLLVWDWERHATDVPVGLDLAHFGFQVQRFFHGRSPAAARPLVTNQIAELLPGLDVDPADADLLVRLYLLEALARNSEGSLRTRLDSRRQLLIEALGPAATETRKVA